MNEMKSQYEQMRVSRDQMEEEMARLREVYDEKMSNVSSVPSHHSIPSPGQSTEKRESLFTCNDCGGGGGGYLDECIILEQVENCLAFRN